MITLTAMADDRASFLLQEASDTTGLVLVDFTSFLALDGSVVTATSVSLALAEVDSANAPGLYEVSLIPTLDGNLFVRLSYGGSEYDALFQVAAAAAGEDPGTAGDFTHTVQDGSTNPIADVLVRVYNSSSQLVAMGTTDVYGEVAFTLPVGTYTVRHYKAGVSFSSDPESITVAANDDVAPRVLAVIPSSASIGDVICVSGQYIHLTDTEVIFGSEVVVVPEGDCTQILAVVEVPVGLTDVVISVRVRKPDPANPGEYLTSNAGTLIRT